jgi:hypothetical protein
VSSSTKTPTRGLDRRNLVRAGVWTVPVVSIAAAAPSFAGVSGCCDLSLGDSSANWEPNELNYIDINVDIQNDCESSLQGLTVMLTICGPSGITYTGADEYLPEGWSQDGQGNKDLTADGNGCYTLTFTSGMTLGAGQTITPKFVAKTQAYDGQGGNRPGGTITINVMGGNGCSQSSQVNLPAVVDAG